VEKWDILREHLLPVLLGDTLFAHRLACKIYLRCGVISYVCDIKKTLADALNPFSRFFPVCHADMGDLLQDSLLYLASEQDFLPLLIPCTEQYRAYVEQHREELECRFLLRDPHSLFTSEPLCKF